MAIKTGTPDADDLTGTDGDDVLSGLGGNDLLQGKLGADSLSGGSGNDVLYAADASDNYGNTFYQGGAFDISTNQLRGGDGNDVLYGAAGADELTGGNGNDQLQASSGSDTLSGGRGNDVMYAALDGHDRFEGGSGTDWAGGWAYDFSQAQRFSISGDTATFTGAGGIAATFHDVEKFLLMSGTGNDTLIGTGAAAVRFFGGGGGDTLIGSAGDDQLKGADGQDILDGAAGNDSLSGGFGEDELSGGSGDDVIVDQLGISRVDAGSGNDSVTYSYVYGNGSPSALERLDATVLLGRGNDRVEFQVDGDAYSGSATVSGGSDNDTLAVDRSSLATGVTATLAGVKAGAVTITATGIEALEVSSGSGNDKLVGGERADRLFAGSGRDTVQGRGGDDELAIGQGGRADGGSGVDRIHLDLHAVVDAQSLTFSGATVNVNATTSFRHMESLDYIGGLGNDTVVGSSRGDAMADGMGNDELHGAGGNDVFTRGVVDTATTWDEVQSALANPRDPGVDVIDGGKGSDTLRFATTSVPVEYQHWTSVVYGSAVIDLLDPSLNGGLARGLTINSIERIEGGVSADTFRGSASAETLVGNSSNDILDGRGGNDTLDGGSGADDLTGGSGRDKFVYSALWDSPSQSYGYGIPEDNSGDHIRDFTRGQDKLVFESIDGATVSAGSSLAWSGTGAQFAFDTDSHELWFDADGTGGASQALRVATLDGVSTLDASDFIFG